MKKLISSFSILLSLMLFSCSQIDIPVNIDTDKKDEGKESLHKKDFFIDELEAEAISNQFMNWNLGVQTRGVENKIQQTSIIKSHETLTDTLMYVFNYEDGFTIISANKGVFPILAYSDEGSFDENNSESMGPFAWLEYMKEEILSNLQETTSDSESLENYNALKIMFAESKKTEILTRAEYYSEIRNYQKVGPLLTTKWSQDSPYNDKCPLDGGVRSAAGCVPIAIAQVVNYHKTLNGENINFTQIANKNGAAIADLVAKIGSGVGMNYNKDYSHPKINIPKFFDYRDRVTNYLNARGYYARFVDLGNQRPVTCPAIYEGFTKNFIGTTNWFGGHWWVMDGYEKYDVLEGWFDKPERSMPQTYSSIAYSILFLHFNWGWGGNHNGFYGVSSSYRDYCKSFKRLDISKK